PFANGAGSITLAKPSKAGSVDIVARLGADPAASKCTAWTPAAATPFGAYLQGKWCGANYDKDPVARATFGIFGSSAKKGPIYIRENF
ncbi:MAG: hypothetical protein H6R18_2242, partial [Proteobacteria bacterium]|nr:hypothetical protein [Pseudomonadota bacterium]